MIGAKIISPSKVGLHFKKGQFLVLGKTSQMNEPNVVDVLGHLFITTKIGGTLFFYILITLALRLKRKGSATIK